LILALYVGLGVNHNRFTIQPSSWKHLWIVDQCWELIFFSVLTAVCVLWRPRKNNQRYGAESLSRGDDRILNISTTDDDVAIPINEEFVYQGGAKKRESKSNPSTPRGSDHDEYEESRKKTITATGFNPEEYSSFGNQTILDIEIEDDQNTIAEELNKID